MERYQVILAYDGTDFCGFQKQAKARTVQGVVESALRQLGWQGKSLLAAGRTDTGVHASGQVIAFDMEWRHSTEDLLRAINASLPQDIVAREVHIIGPDFHPRYDALSRCYQYRLFCDQIRDPLRERFAWRVWPEVEPACLIKAAGYLLGKHDFAAFGTPPRTGGNTVRNVSLAGWKQERPYLVFEIVAEAFLYHMVRHLVHLQVMIGQGSQELGIISRYLDGEISSPPVGLAPSNGLVLTKVNYR